MPACVSVYCVPCDTSFVLCFGHPKAASFKHRVLSLTLHPIPWPWPWHCTLHPSRVRAEHAHVNLSCISFCARAATDMRAHMSYVTSSYVICHIILCHRWYAIPPTPPIPPQYTYGYIYICICTCIYTHIYISRARGQLAASNGSDKYADTSRPPCEY